MCEPRDKKEFVGKLLAQDPMPADEQLQYKETLFRTVKRRVRLKKIIVGATYCVLFFAAFWAFRQSSHTGSLVRSICWGVVSMHILLWFLVYFLRMTYRLAAEITDGKSATDEKYQRRKTDRFVTIIAICVFLFSTILLYSSFSLNSPLSAARMTAGILWGPVFFLFWYPFGTASLVAKLWIEYKTMELGIPESEE